MSSTNNPEPSDYQSGSDPQDPRVKQVNNDRDRRGRIRELTFGKVVGASAIGVFVALSFMGVISAILIALMIASIASSEPEIRIADNSVLELNLSGSIAEAPGAPSLSNIFKPTASLTLFDYLQIIEDAGKDARIAGIRLNMDGFAASAAQLEALTRALNAFRKGGNKFIYAFGSDDGFSEGDYILASVADSLFMLRSGAVELNGIYTTLEFYKPLMQKLHIEPIMVRAGTFKSAVEPFTRESASPEYVEAITSVLDAQYDRMKDLVAEGRHLARADVDSIVASYPLLRAEEARDHKLVDRLIYRDEIDTIMRNRLGITDSTEEIETVGPATYHDQMSDGKGHEGEIAILYANGGISSGESDYNPSPIMGGEQLGSTSFVEEMQKLRTDPNVKAIILRVNSPGGSLPPSIAMWREVKLAAAAKPVVVSMANVAASGGYYISAPATEIVAEETTVTGSIGVFALAFNLSGLYRETIGINTQTIRTGPHADILSLMRDMEPDEIAFAEAEIDTVYHQFLQVVADGRSMNTSDVDSIAQGRIWTGKQALDRGLVDHLGGFETAFARAEDLAGLTHGSYDISVHPRPKSQIEALLDMIDVAATSGLDQSKMNELARIEWLRTMVIRTLENYSGPQVRLTGVHFE